VAHRCVTIVCQQCDDSMTKVEQQCHVRCMSCTGAQAQQ
jgi:hypothetical protein